MLGNSRVVERLVASQGGLSFVKLVIYYYILFNMHDVVTAQNNSGHDFDIIVLGDTKYSGTQLTDITDAYFFSTALVNYCKTEIKSSDSLLLSSAKQERQMPISERRGEQTCKKLTEKRIRPIK
jgi:hypothetical protein